MKILFYSISMIVLLGCQSTPENTINRYESFCSNFKHDDSLNKYYPSKAINRVHPEYPLRAAKKGLEGYVVFEFDISTEGQPVNINITESYPGNTFKSATTKALKQWRYEPAILNGKPVDTKCHTLRLDMTMG